MMTNITDRAREQWRLKKRKDPSASRARVEFTKKAPGSKVLMLGKWVEIGQETGE